MSLAQLSSAQLSCLITVLSVVCERWADRANPELNLTTCKVLIFMEGGKLENPEKNPRSTGETNYNSASHEFRSKLEKQRGAIPRWSTHPAITPNDRA